MNKVKRGNPNINIAVLYERVNRNNELMNERFETIESQIEEIKSNHIIHLAEDIALLHEKIDKVQGQIRFWAGGLTLLGFLIGIIITVMRTFIK